MANGSVVTTELIQRPVDACSFQIQVFEELVPQGEYPEPGDRSSTRMGGELAEFARTVIGQRNTACDGLLDLQRAQQVAATDGFPPSQRPVVQAMR